MGLQNTVQGGHSATTNADVHHVGNAAVSSSASDEEGNAECAGKLSFMDSAGGEYPGSNGLDREDNKGYCFITVFAGPER
ncbi:hypothetical protein Tco_1432923, partial [Tanacetum coccineum]